MAYLNKLTEELKSNSYANLYIDGEVTIQNVLKDDLIDEMIITTIPILLSDDISLTPGNRWRETRGSVCSS